MTKLMAGDLIAIAAIAFFMIFLERGSDTRKDKDNKVWIYISISLLILVAISVGIYFVKYQISAKAVERLVVYLWFVVGIFASIIYSYSFVPYPRYSRSNPEDAYIMSIRIGVATITLGVVCFFLHTEFPEALFFGALEPIAALATSIGGSLTAAAAAADAKLNPNRGMFDSTLKFFKPKK
ncbi:MULTISPECIES: hypothetical protein [Comamonas]|uniref:hypothetical protein n=1 Tax=Comamonas TaxID=283 RepID=UPI00257FF560|nr:MULTISPECIES: hypothetical protein [Comamonas]